MTVNLLKKSLFMKTDPFPQLCLVLSRLVALEDVIYFSLRERYTSLYLGRKLSCCGATLSMYSSLH
jgi:hypothetical protein